MKNPIATNFDWSSLYGRYDATCKRYDAAAVSLRGLDEKPRNDRYLYYTLVKQARQDRAAAGTIKLETYEAILYWKLYSQPAAVKSVCHRISGDEAIRKSIRKGLQSLVLPEPVHRKMTDIKQLYDLIDKQKPCLFGMAGHCTFPARSTLLHFVYPDVVPIFDKQVLRAVGVTEANANRSYSNLVKYTQFAWKIAGNERLIPHDWPESPLRLLDMALWVIRGQG